MDRSKLHELFLRHRGELSQLARELDVYESSITNWFRGSMNSRPMERAIYKRAEELLEREELDRLSFTELHPRLLTFAGVQAT